VTTAIIDGNMIKNMDDFHDQISKALPFPDYYGRNFDALWDVLSRDIEKPYEIIWKDHTRSEEILGKDFVTLKRIFKRLTDFWDEDVKITYA